MTDKAISPLRRRMTEDMTIRGFTAGTQRVYIRAVRDFTAFLGRAPDRAGAEELRRYQLHMRSQGAAATSALLNPLRAASRTEPLRHTSSKYLRKAEWIGIASTPLDSICLVRDHPCSNRPSPEHRCLLSEV